MAPGNTRLSLVSSPQYWPVIGPHGRCFGTGETQCFHVAKITTNKIVSRDVSVKLKYLCHTNILIFQMILSARRLCLSSEDLYSQL